MDNSFSPVPKRMMRPGTTCACHDSSIPHIYGYLKHNQSIRPHPDHAVGSTLSISMPDPPVSWSLHSPDSCVCTRPHLRAPPSHSRSEALPQAPPRSFIHHFIGIHSTVHSSRDKHHADPCCPHTNPRRSALSTSTSTKRPCQPPARPHLQRAKQKRRSRTPARERRSPNREKYASRSTSYPPAPHGWIPAPARPVPRQRADAHP